ncbi:hypothetical protein AB0P17_36075 [Streptomyces sp. NPDC088124]|uniref:hypothetical protein n=1 Tax=Streptomyces sp. NPDC088124 TaxID=3154654 RepID=UPI00342DECED
MSGAADHVAYGGGVDQGSRPQRVGYCLGPQGGSPTPGAPVILTTGSGCSTFTWNHRGTPEQPNHWEIVETSTGQCTPDTGRRSQAVLGTCGSTTTPGPQVWTPQFDKYWNYDQF